MLLNANTVLFFFQRFHHKQVYIYIIYIYIYNPLWCSDAILWHRTGSTSAQVMDWCLMTPSHDLNQCWLLINEVLYYSQSAQAIILCYEFENQKLLPHLPGTNELTQIAIELWCKIFIFLPNNSTSAGLFVYIMFKLKLVVFIMKCHGLSAAMKTPRCSFYLRLLIHNIFRNIFALMEISYIIIFSSLIHTRTLPGEIARMRLTEIEMQNNILLIGFKLLK